MGKRDSYNVVLIRCGPTDWDADGRIVGRIDLPLAADSSLWLSDLLAGLEGADLSCVMHGSDQCLLATAEAVARVTGGKLKRVPELVDVGMGLWEGLREQELEEKFPSAHREWRENPSNVSIPEGEPLRDAGRRLVSTIGRTLEKLRNPDPGVGIVLRPISYEVVRAWLTGTDVDGGAFSAEGPAHVWHEVERARLREAREGAGVGG
ncbi:MAG: histidine phosphatase family protein [Planctomycetota bacterium]